MFWPEAGEYANATNFVTDLAFEAAVQFRSFAERVEELALFSDGLQRLALDYGTRTGHPGFFAPLFRQLRAAADPAAVAGPFRAFLNSPAINRRTDDDKTLILATRKLDRAPAADAL